MRACEGYRYGCQRVERYDEFSLFSNVSGVGERQGGCGDCGVPGNSEDLNHAYTYRGTIIN